MRLIATLALLSMTVACSGGGHNSPTGPSLVAPSLSRLAIPASTADPRIMRPVMGQVTDALSGAGVPGVTIRVPEVFEATSDAGGQFGLDAEALDGRYRVVASGAAVVAHEPTLVFPGGPALLPLIPATFNMVAFDEMVRQFGGVAVVKRWIAAPVLIVEMSLLDREMSIDPSGFPKESVIASEQQQSEAAVAALIDNLTRALPLLTGGRFPGFSSIERVTTPAGFPVLLDRLGAITVVRYPSPVVPCSGYGAFAYFNDFEAAFGRVFLPTCSDASLAAHELGHALGYGHVTAVPSVMKAVVTGYVTEFDRQATTIAYQRPLGNRAPDADPEAFTVNEPLRARARGIPVFVGPVP